MSALVLVSTNVIGKDDESRTENMKNQEMNMPEKEERLQKARGVLLELLTMEDRTNLLENYDLMRMITPEKVNSKIGPTKKFLRKVKKEASIA